MMNLKELAKAVQQVAEDKGLEAQKVMEAIESAVAAAYKKEYGKKGEIIRSKLDPNTGVLKFWQVKTVVDKNSVRFIEEKTGDKEDQKEKIKPESDTKLPRYNPDRHILLEEAQKIRPDVQVGEEIVFPLETREDFGRIAAQTAKQVILQRLRESERESILSEWKEKEGQIVSGIIQRFERGHVYVDLGRTIGIMFANESIPGEHYRPGERLRFLVLAVQEESRLPGIILSRSHPNFVKKLFEMEVPELADGICEIKSIAREPGSRSKIAVISHEEGVDPVGACVGQRGTRVMAVTNELGQEKIDVVEWSDDPAKLIANAFSPAKAVSVEIFPRREARVYVPEDQLSLAIGKSGQNVRLVAKLTGWKIDVRSQTRPEEVQEGGIASAFEEEKEEEGRLPEGSDLESRKKRKEDEGKTIDVSENEEKGKNIESKKH